MSIKIKKMVRAIAGDDTSQSVRISALESAVGSKDTDAGSLKKRCADIETDVGASTSGSESGIHKDIKDINTAIGDPSDPAEGTILARLYALEHPPAQSGSGSGTE